MQRCYEVTYRVSKDYSYIVTVEEEPGDELYDVELKAEEAADKLFEQHPKYKEITEDAEWEVELYRK